MNPKLFISYSWSSNDHEAAVIQLATELRESGVDVILDKWDLKEGHDAHAFMEQMVANPEITKVAILCDRAYVTKADGRKGGVGTETQIITPEVYNKQAQSKFVAVVMERDDEGKPCLPIYYKSRIYIDLSDPTSFAAEFEKIVRWVYDQPLHKKPEIGKKPAFLVEDERAIKLATSARFRRAIDAVKNRREFAAAAVEEYFFTLAEEMKSLRISSNQSQTFDDEVVASIDGFLPYRDEAVSLFETIALYQDDPDTRRSTHRFFERLIPLLSRPEDVTRYSEWDFDNLKFIIHELYLYGIASLIKNERFDAANNLMGEFYAPGESDYGRGVMVPYTVFRSHLRSLKHRNDRKKLGRLSLHADILKERCKGVAVDFRSLMQTDFVLFLRSAVSADEGFGWWPETLVWLDRSGPFEIFARSRSGSYFSKVSVLLGIKGKVDLEPVLGAFREDRRRLPRWEVEAINPERLLGYDEIATKP